MSFNKAWKVLLFSEDEDDYIMILDILSAARGVNFSLDWKTGSGETVEEICANQYDVILMDHDLHAADSLTMVGQFHRACPHTHLILATEWPDFEKIHQRGKEQGAAFVIQKSQVTSPLLIQILEQIL